MTDERIKVQLSKPERRFVKVYQDFLRSEQLSAEEKLIYIALKSFVGYGEDDGDVYPSMGTLCQLTSMSRPRATRTITSLIRKGIVTKKRRGLEKTNIYTLRDNPAMWAAESEAELRDLAETEIPYSSAELIEELKRRGVIEIIDRIKKAPMSGTDQSSDIDRYTHQHIAESIINYTGAAGESQDTYSMEELKELYSYNLMIEQEPRETDLIDYAIQIIYTAVNGSTPTIRVKKADLSRETVKKALLELNHEDILYVIRKYKDQATKIDNPESYILTMLFTAHGQLRAETDNQVRTDFF